METTEFTTDFYPNYYSPFFVKQIIYREYAGEDGCLPVTQVAHCLDSYKDSIDDVVFGKSAAVLPKGFVITDDGKHYKWTYFGDHRYSATMAKTSSDNRAGMNMASLIDNLML